jgi:hypothetical protein
MPAQRYQARHRTDFQGSVARRPSVVKSGARRRVDLARGRGVRHRAVITWRTWWAARRRRPPAFLLVGVALHSRHRRSLLPRGQPGYRRRRRRCLGGVSIALASQCRAALPLAVAVAVAAGVAGAPAQAAGAGGRRTWAAWQRNIPLATLGVGFAFAAAISTRFRTAAQAKRLDRPRPGDAPGDAGPAGASSVSDRFPASRWRS